MRIKQCEMTLSLRQRKDFNSFIDKYSFKKYKDKNAPVVFYSLWKFRLLQKHRAMVIVVWRGSDILKMRSRLKEIKKMKNVYHVAISSFIAKDLEEFDIKYKFIPLAGKKIDDFKLCPLGEEIYTYVPNIHPKYFKRYGGSVLEKIQKKCKYKINISRSSTYYKMEKLRKIYERCFCGLRLTKHDGLPNQVIEMGVMGRRTIYNGDIPGSISWNKNNIDEIIKNIDIESQKIGTINYEVSNNIKNFIDVKNDWLDTKFWK